MKKKHQNKESGPNSEYEWNPYADCFEDSKALIISNLNEIEDSLKV